MRPEDLAAIDEFYMGGLAATEALAAMLDGLELFGMGYSWGGFESLVIPFDAGRVRTASAWPPADWNPHDTLGIRLSIGLEDPEDLMHDLERGFAAMGPA